jgi:hypothetical protein
MQGRKKHKIKKATGPQGIFNEINDRSSDLLDFQ